MGSELLCPSKVCGNSRPPARAPSVTFQQQVTLKKKKKVKFGIETGKM